MKQLGLIRFELPAAYSSLETLTDRLRAIIEPIGGMTEPDITIYNIQLATDEIFANIAGHAYEGRTDGQVTITLIFDNESRDLTIEMHDTGAPFDPSSVPDPDLDDPPEGGYGLFLIRHLMDDVMYTTNSDGNCWRLIKRL